MAAPQATRRLLKDIERIRDPLMTEQKIWYCIAGDTMTKGFALIEGPENTPYEGCLLLFSVSFPNDYPFSPPKVLFLTTDGRTRFHPNLYVDGKVCLSILGTYSGPSWSGTQSLSSVLLSIQGLLDKNPLAHEPAYEKGTLLETRHKQYADAVEHNMVKYMLKSIERFEQDPTKHEWSVFESIVKERLPSLKEILRKKVLIRSEYPEVLWNNLMYGMSFRSYWKTFRKENSWVDVSA
jgi:ubiquitin-protein ligase